MKMNLKFIGQAHVTNKICKKRCGHEYKK